MVVTIDLKCYSKLQYDISKYHEKSPADPLDTGGITDLRDGLIYPHSHA